ncbi:MAG: peptide chain release factor N(5)-glutamine methyltransferase [Actinomycetaceae bacterium]|nr:peptide chain release factor N(5)-glutamine methyltransferase [Actinomycetaceae bacterium]
MPAQTGGVNPHRVWNDSTRILTAAGVPSPQVDAREILQAVLDQPPYMWPATIPQASAERIQEMVAQRAKRVPLQHVLGKMWFMGLPLKAQPGVFNVRPETEVLAQWAIESLTKLQGATPGKSGGSALHVLDMCTGSGALAIAISHAHPNAAVTAIEKSAVAAQAAKDNADRLNLPVNVIEGDALAVNAQWAGRFDLVVSNPPYVPARELDPELDHDPAEALWGGGEDGLDFIRSLLPIAYQYLKPGGRLGVEHDDTQGAKTVELARAAGFEAHTIPDLNQRDRFLIATKPGA